MFLMCTCFSIRLNWCPKPSASSAIYTFTNIICNEVATLSRLPSNTGLFCKKNPTKETYFLQKRPLFSRSFLFIATSYIYTVICCVGMFFMCAYFSPRSTPCLKLRSPNCLPCIYSPHSLLYIYGIPLWLYTHDRACVGRINPWLCIYSLHPLRHIYGAVCHVLCYIYTCSVSNL